jgi:tetratricopeptide (TPR) repeat protein
MKDLLNKLITMGNHHYSSEMDVKRNVVSNQVLIIFALGLSFFVFYLVLMGVSLFFRILDFWDQVDVTKTMIYLLPSSLGMIAIIITSFIIKNRTGKNTFYLGLAFFSGICYLILTNVTVTYTMHAFLLFFTLIPVPFFIMGRENFQTIALWEGVLLCIVFIIFYYITHFEPILVFPPIIATITNYTIFFLTIAIFMSSAYYLWNETAITENKLFEERKKTMEALDELNALKTQQDGDFFLISLLTDPLSYNNNKSELIEISTFLKSKKEFQFKKYKKEIGGDLNIVDQVRLGGRNFTLFLNADAMGKSIQGASGALIFGASLKSLLLRTKEISNHEEAYPEIWLKHIYHELEQIFETFNCSMLVSGILGLIEEETGLVYYINAEHPFMILYRDQKANFIETELILRKFGTPGMNDELRIKLFHLKPGDYLICGSDGKDDIYLKEEDGSTVLNYDENYFLTILESSGPNVNDIYSKLKEVSEITDDLSLISIHYKDSTNLTLPIRDQDFTKSIKLILKEKKEKNFRKALDYALETEKLYPNDTLVLKQIVLLSLRLGEYDLAIAYSKQILDISPLENKYLFYISYAYYKKSEINKAVIYAQRTILREPDNIRYLSHLAQLYHLANDDFHAKIHARKGLKLDEGNPILLKILG